MEIHGKQSRQQVRLKNDTKLLKKCQPSQGYEFQKSNKLAAFDLKKTNR
jgi:hypothetical protein